MEGAASPFKSESPRGIAEVSARGGVNLSAFDALYAPVVGSWVCGEEELRILAPGTPPPLTPSKVVGWGKERGRRFLFRLDGRGGTEPVGYAELNPMPRCPEDFWIGHFVVDPKCRGRSIGTLFARALLAKAFDELAARSVVLVVFPDNEAAIRCYQRAGMRVMRRERKYFETTRRRCEFLRMEMTRGEFEMAGGGAASFGADDIVVSQRPAQLFD